MKKTAVKSAKNAGQNQKPTFDALDELIERFGAKQNNQAEYRVSILDGLRRRNPFSHRRLYPEDVLRLMETQMTGAPSAIVEVGVRLNSDEWAKLIRKGYDQIKRIDGTINPVAPPVDNNVVEGVLSRIVAIAVKTYIHEVEQKSG